MNNFENIFSLSHSITFHVPSTIEASNPITLEEHLKRTALIADIMGQWFGGASVDKSQGWYKSVETHNMIVEDINKVKSYSSDEAIKTHSKELLQLALDKCKEWKQESIGLEIDNRLYFIS